MPSIEVFKFNREGGWESQSPTHFRYARTFQMEFREALASLLRREQKVLLEHAGNRDHAERSGALDLDDFHDQVHRTAEASLLFTCMSIEGFINHYGTRRLGEKFYKKNIERNGITEKISIIYILCFDVKLDASDSFLLMIRRLFDKRNALVHPKTIEMHTTKPDRSLYVHPEDIEIDFYESALTKFGAEFGSRDPSITQCIYFPS